MHGVMIAIEYSYKLDRKNMVRTRPVIAQRVTYDLWSHQAYLVVLLLLECVQKQMLLNQTPMCNLESVHLHKLVELLLQ